jgi:hypothetical protein
VAVADGEIARVERLDRRILHAVAHRPSLLLRFVPRLRRLYSPKLNRDARQGDAGRRARCGLSRLNMV